MALLSVIRRWHFREEIPIREIERRTGLLREVSLLGNGMAYRLEFNTTANRDDDGCAVWRGSNFLHCHTGLAVRYCNPTKPPAGTAVCIVAELSRSST